MAATSTTLANARDGRRSAKKRSKTEEAYDYVKSRIITAVYRPGQYLNIAMICEETGLGRTPVHDALLRLSHDGLIDIFPKKGAIVRPDSLSEVSEILEARWVMEPYCAALAAERVNGAQIREMEKILEKCSGLVTQRGFEEFMLLDGQFHSVILEASGNKTLAGLILSLHEKATRLWFLAVWEVSDLARTQREHEAILAAIRRGDPAGATSAMQQHITSLRRRVMAGHRSAASPADGAEEAPFATGATSRDGG